MVSRAAGCGQAGGLVQVHMMALGRNVVKRYARRENA